MGKLEHVLIELDLFNKKLLHKKRGGESITKEEYDEVRERVKAINLETANVEVPEIGRLLELYDLGLGVRYLEPGYTKLNAAFAWMEQNAAEGDDFEEYDDD